MVKTGCRPNGFTLVEVMIVIAIMGTVMAIAVPGIKTLLNTQKMKSATFDLVTTAMLARSEAIKWGSGPVTFPPDPPPVPPSIRIAALNNNFNNGWCILFNGDSAITCPAFSSVNTAADVPDGVMQIIKPSSRITYTFGTTAGPIVFSKNGRIPTAVKILVKDDDGFATDRCVTFDTNGNASVRVMSSPTPSCS